MSRRFLSIFAIILFIIIVGLAVALFAIPAPTSPPEHAATSTPATASTDLPDSSQASSSQPLDAQVSVSSPQPNAVVGQTFTVTGIAPNAWYFEAVFPVQVRDADDNLVGQGQGQAQSDWTKPGPVPFAATVTIENGYHGLATLILSKDNPSELPQNADEVTIPVVIQ